MAPSKINISLVFSLIATFFLMAAADVTSSGGGEWVLLHRSVGISAMHMQLLHNNKVVIFDRTDFGVSNLSLPAGAQCRRNDAVLTRDCSAHSLLYDPASNTYRPLTVHTNVWCSSGAVHPDGTLVQTGGYNKGEKKIRLFSPAADAVASSGDDRSDWKELPEDLLVRRWYASNHILPDGRVVVVGGRQQFNYEFFPKTPSSSALYDLRFLNETNDPGEENNLYPFLHLLPDGNLFVFANRRSISLDYINNRIVREFPVISGEKRNYPSTGSSVLLPLKGRFPVAEVLVCGGAPNLSFTKAYKMKIYVEASNTCGRLRVTDSDPQWKMEKMPMGRVMGDMILLPSGDVLIINGASKGTAGWENAVGPALNPVLYRPTESNPTKRFAVMNASTIPRLYHSAAILLPDGRILVGGSNPHVVYKFTAPYPTDLSLEAFSPRYMAPQYSDLRPWIIYVGARDRIVSYGQIFSVAFKVTNYCSDQETTVSMIAPPFATHSFSMNQRMIYLDIIGGVRKILGVYKVQVIAPATRNVAPPGYYMMFVVHGGIPGECVWIKVNN